MTAAADKTHSLIRLEIFSDAVIAVAITLMVLDLKPPDITPHVRQDPFDFSFLNGYWPKLLAVALSFLIISARWTGMLTYFRRVPRASPTLIWLTLTNLLSICLVPWGAAFLSAHPTLPQAVATYGFLVLCLIVTAGVLEKHIDSKYPAPQEWHYRNTFVIGAVWAISIPLAFVSIYLSFAIFAVIAPFFFVPRVHQRVLLPMLTRRRPQSRHDDT